MPELSYQQEHLRLHEELYLRKRSSRSLPARSKEPLAKDPEPLPQDEPQKATWGEMDEKDSFERAEKLTILLAFTLMIMSFYLVVSITPSTLGSVLGGVAILVAICSGVNIVRRGKI
jgi:hypothetical protein